MNDRQSNNANEQEQSPSPFRWQIWTPVLLVLAVATYVLLPRLAELDELLGVIEHLRWWAIGLAVLSQGISHLGGGYMVHRVARLTGDRLSIWHSTRLGLAASAVGLVAAGPIGYAASTLHWLKRQGFSRQGAALLGWLPALLNAGALVALALLGLLQLLLEHGIRLPWPVTVLLAVIGSAILGALMIPVFTSDERLASLIGRLRRWWSRMRKRTFDERVTEQDREKLVQARRSLGRGAWRGVLLGTAIRAGFDMLTVWWLFVAAGHRNMRVGDLMAGFALPQVVGRIVPGGIGLVEGGMVGLYAALGVPLSTSVVVVLAYRVLSFWLPLVLGVPFAILEQRRRPQPAGSGQ
ncbi:MAG TPA: YbhN family protein [Gemmatimonadaceae bacterium]